MAANGLGCRITSFVFFLLGFGCFLTAFSTHYWMDEEQEQSNWGLWRKCVAGQGCASTVGEHYMTASFIGAQVLMCMTLVMGALTLGAYIAWMATEGEISCVIAWAAGISGGFCNAMGIICWGNESFRYYGANVLAWSFWLNLGGCILTIINSGITGCLTGCGSYVSDTPSSAMYGSGAARVTTAPLTTRGYAQNAPHNSSDQDYSDISGDYSVGNVHAQPRPGPGRNGNRKY